MCRRRPRPRRRRNPRRRPLLNRQRRLHLLRSLRQRPRSRRRPARRRAGDEGRSRSVRDCGTSGAGWATRRSRSARPCGRARPRRPRGPCRPAGTRRPGRTTWSIRRRGQAWSRWACGKHGSHRHRRRHPCLSCRGGRGREMVLLPRMTPQRGRARSLHPLSRERGSRAETAGRRPGKSRESEC